MESTVLTQTLKRKRRRRPWSSRKIDLVPKGVDRLSILPDELLSHILSSLPTTNDAIRTSILATRWKYLWTCVPNHDFQYDPNCPWRGSRAKYRSFTNSVDRLFRLCDPGLGIDKFRILSTYKTDDNPKLDEWASFLISRNIKEFHLQLSNSLVCQFPSSLLTCQTLVDLQLFGKFELNLTTGVSLPNLKTLFLRSDQYSGNETVSSLLSGCPVLEVLSMTRLTSDDDDNDDEMVLNISAPSLKTLLLDFNPCKPSLEDDDDVQEMYDYGTIIDAPNLEYLTIYDYGSAYISFNYMPSLVEADIDVRLLEEIPPESGLIGTNAMGVLLSAISSAKCLSLHGNAIQSLFDSYDLHLPKFSKLERLALGRFCRWELLPNLLESMPKLQGLVFLEGLADSATTKFNWSPPEDAPLCLRFHLKTIEIHNFYGGEDELKLVKYMLEKAKVLEKTTIYPSTNSKNFVKDIWLASRDKLLKSPLGSRACQINFII